MGLLVYVSALVIVAVLLGLRLLLLLLLMLLLHICNFTNLGYYVDSTHVRAFLQDRQIDTDLHGNVLQI